MMQGTVRQHLSRVVLLALLIASCSERAGRFGEGPVDLTRWTAINYSYPANEQPLANWTLSEDKQTVTQTVNANPSIFLSDRELGDTSIAGTWFVERTSDDDFIGFVFAYQDPGRFYLFDWKGGSQQDGNVGEADRGMSVKVVDAPYAGPRSGSLEAGKPFDGKDLWHTQGVGGKVRLLDHEPTEGWTADKPYRFQLDFHPGQFRIVVTDGDRVIYDKTHHDDTYRSGRFGFYNFSQEGVVYKGFETRELPSSETIVRLSLLPILFLLLVVILVVLVVFLLLARRRSRDEQETTEQNDEEKE